MGGVLSKFEDPAKAACQHVGGCTPSWCQAIHAFRRSRTSNWPKRHNGRIMLYSVRRCPEDQEATGQNAEFYAHCERGRERGRESERERERQRERERECSELRAPGGGLLLREGAMRAGERESERERVLVLSEVSLSSPARLIPRLTCRCSFESSKLP